MFDITNDFAGFYRTLTSDTQMRWLGPEKGIVSIFLAHFLGVIHLATAAVLNAIWDL